MQAILAQHIPSIFRPNSGLLSRLTRRFFGPRIPAVGETFSFVVTAQHWLRAKESCRLNGSRSTHCVLAQAIAERLRLPYVSVGGEGVASAALDDSYDDGSNHLYFRVDNAGRSLIARFDSAEDDADPYYRMPNNFPFNITATRYASTGAAFTAKPAVTEVVIA